MDIPHPRFGFDSQIPNPRLVYGCVLTYILSTHSIMDVLIDFITSRARSDRCKLFNDPNSANMRQ